LQLSFLFLLRGEGLLGGLRLGGALLELVHAAGGVHELLLARVKGMADVANAHDDGGASGTRLDHVAAGATDFRVIIFRMNVRSHKRRNSVARKGLMTRGNFEGRLTQFSQPFSLNRFNANSKCSRFINFCLRGLHE